MRIIREQSTWFIPIISPILFATMLSRSPGWVNTFLYDIIIQACNMTLADCSTKPTNGAQIFEKISYVIGQRFYPPQNHQHYHDLELHDYSYIYHFWYSSWHSILCFRGWGVGILCTYIHIYYSIYLFTSFRFSLSLTIAVGSEHRLIYLLVCIYYFI
jgi:hypothetical protein